jgi:hypothetical protein
MPTINLTDDEYEAVTAAIRRAIEDNRFPRAPRLVRCARRWRGSQCEGASCFAMRSRFTTRPSRRRDPRTTLTWSSSADGWRGFIVLDYMSRVADAMGALAVWVQAGKIVDKIDMQHGLEDAPATLRRLLEGCNKGEQLLRVAE